MMRDRIKKKLQEHQKELNQFHIKSLYLFGSVARGEESQESDIDILVSFDDPISFDRYMELKFYLEELFQRKIDLVTEAGLRAELKNSVIQDLFRAA